MLGVRADFEARCADYPQLAGAVQDRYLVTAMTERQLRLAITEPAKKAAPASRTTWLGLLAEVRTRQPGTAGAGVLPLLSHALDQAWRTRAGTVLSLPTMSGPAASKGPSPTAHNAPTTAHPRPAGRGPAGVHPADRHQRDGVDTADRAPRAELTEGKTQPRPAMWRRSWRPSPPNGCSPWRPVPWRSATRSADGLAAAAR